MSKWTVCKTSIRGFSLLQLSDGREYPSGPSVQLPTDYAERLALCTNTLAGIADPSAIPALIEAVEDIGDTYRNYPPASPERRLRAALARVKGKE